MFYKFNYCECFYKLYSFILEMLLNECEVRSITLIVVVMLPEALALQQSRSIWTESRLPVFRYDSCFVSKKL